jgi:hypothetical protein
LRVRVDHPRKGLVVRVDRNGVSIRFDTDGLEATPGKHRLDADLGARRRVARPVDRLARP